MADSTQMSGGTFYAVLRRVGLADETGLSLKRSLPVMAVLCWLPLLALTAIDGTAWGNAVDIPFLRDLGPYGRFLIGVPLLLFGERIASAELGAVSAHFRTIDLIPDADSAEADAARARLRTRLDSGVVELLLLAIAFALPWLTLGAAREAQTGAGVSGWIFEAAGTLTLAGWWYSLFAIPLIAFISLRWAWRYVAWSLFLRSMAKLDLQLQPTHPDRMGGLDPLVVAQSSFVMFLLVGSVVLSTVMGNDILHTDTTITSLYPEIATWIGVSLLLVVGPLLVFAPALRRAKIKGMMDYGVLGDSLTETFADRWRTKDAGGMIDTGDPSAVADFGAMYETVVSMRLFPFSLRQASGIAGILLIPFVPLLLTAVSPKDLLHRLLGMIA